MGRLQASPENKGEGLTFIMFWKAFVDGCFEQKLIREDEFKDVVVSHWLEVISELLGREGSSFSLEKADNKIPILLMSSLAK